MQSSNYLDFLVDYSDINIRLCNDVVHNKTWYEASSKVCYDIWVMLDGEVVVTKGDEEYRLKKHDVFFFYPYELYSAHCTTESCHFIYIHFDFNVANNSRGLNDFYLTGHIPSEHIEDEVLLFTKTYLKYKENAPLSYLSLKGYFTVLLSEAIRYQLQNTTSLRKSISSKKLKRLKNSFDYIAENIDKPIYIKELAEQVGMSEKYFISFFKKEVGITPSKYITQLKMNKALAYIYEQNYSIKEISHMLGYSDQFTFTKAFRKIYNISPSKAISNKL